MNYILFDPITRESLFPIAYTRPVSGIRIGMLTLQQKWDDLLSAATSVLVPQYLSSKYKTISLEKNLYINGALLPNKDIIRELTGLKAGQKLIYKGTLVAYCTGPLTWEKIEEETVEFEILDTALELRFLKNTWEIISFLSEELRTDFESKSRRFSNFEVPEYATVISEKNIYAGEDVTIGACILNATKGEIILDDGVEIMDGAIIKGPVYIGKHSTVKMGAKLYGPISIGEHCKVGGELIESVFQAYSNKGHDGFLGHSYLGEWCNLGADTNTSNLKNSYEPVRLWNYFTSRFDRTGEQFLGLIMGDHSKTGINTMLNTGTVIGVACNVYGAGFPRNFVPDFSIGSSHRMAVFALKNVIKMAKAMMARRNIKFGKIDEEIFSEIFNKTRHLRRN